MMRTEYTTTAFDGRIQQGALTGSRRTGHVLVVDDDPVICNLLLDCLPEHNFPAMAVSDRTRLHHHLAGAEPCLILLDLQLDREDGLDLLKEIRSRSDIPVVIMTGHHLTEMDRVIGLELGADDYIMKPFGFRELLARVKAVLRRQEFGRQARSRKSDRGGYRFEGWQLDRQSRVLTNPLGIPVPLSKGEYALLLAFLAAPHRPLTREQLLQATRMHEDLFDRSIDVRVMRLRRKLEADPRAPKLILSERGVGYVFAAVVQSYCTSDW